MSNFEEKKYKQTLIQDTPDLWDRINSELSDDMYTTDSRPDMNMTPNNNSSPRKNKKLRPSRIYKTAGIIAACIAVLFIPLALLSNNSMNEKESNAILKDAIHGVAPESDSITNNNIGYNESVNNSDPSYNDIENSITSEDVTQDENTNDKTSPNDNNNNITNDQIIVKITATQQVDELGLVYEGIVTASKITNVANESKVFISLKYLSRTDLGKQHDIGSSMTLTLKDTSYTSSLNNPYYATSITY